VDRSGSSASIAKVEPGMFSMARSTLAKVWRGWKPPT